MPKTNRPNKMLRVLKWTLLGVLIGSRAGATMMPPVVPKSPQSDATPRWGELQTELGPVAPTISLDPELRAFVAAAVTKPFVETAIRQSYSMATTSEIEALDRLWIEVLAAEGASDDIEVFLSVRASLPLNAPETADFYLDNWVWKAKAGGDCDRGNPGNDKPVGRAGESPNGSDFGDGIKGKSQ